MSSSKIRPTTRADLPALRALVAATGLVPAGRLDAVMATFPDADDADDCWLTYVHDGPAALACYARAPRSVGAFNLYRIMVHPDRQGTGIGSALLEHVESTLAEQGERILLLEMSGYDQFQRLRNFCRKSGFHEEARIRDYFKPGEDKIIFRKNLVRR